MTSGLHRQRIDAVLSVLSGQPFETVLDLGCGEGDLLESLASLPGLRSLTGIEIDNAAASKARARIARLAVPEGVRIDVVNGSITDRPERFRGHDAAILLEVIEHVDPDRLAALERAVFGAMRPALVILTTPNSEYNHLLGVPTTRFRHPDHRFEWDRARFGRWIARVASAAGYVVEARDVPAAHPVHGGPTQMAVFRQDSGQSKCRRT